MAFIKAKWNNLILANYVVPADLLLPYLPKRTRLDSYHGEYYVSLVAFMFHDTRVLGLPIPFHVNFEEVNLRFYVTPENDFSKRAVVFIREFVPRKAIELIANSLFKENYFTTKMKHETYQNEYSYSWLMQKKWNKIAATIETSLKLPDSGSLDEFITEHYWGYTKSGESTTEYEVWHPQWETCSVSKYSIDVDFGEVYGDNFSFLSKTKPHNVCFAKGSPIKVYYSKSFR